MLIKICGIISMMHIIHQIIYIFYTHFQRKTVNLILGSPDENLVHSEKI